MEIKEEILEALKDDENLAASKPFVFCGNLATASNPGLCLNNHGTIGLPLSSHDADAIKARAKQSPFGKGEKTMVDLKVRKSWELNPSEFSLKNPEWRRVVEIALTSVYTGLDLGYGTGNVQAKLYKLLLYEDGAFFKPHKDSEKEEGMFGTMIISLPAKHEGGTLVFNHGKRTHSFKTSDNSEFGFSMAAWYADVTHEVLPVTSGLRLVLTYNLIKRGGSAIIQPFAAQPADEHPLKIALNKYNEMLAGEYRGPEFLVHGLEYEYTQASLSASALKGVDAAQVGLLRETCKELGFELYLATLEREILRVDEANYTGYCNVYSSADDGEEIERTETLKCVVDLAGQKVSQALDLADEGLLDDELLDDQAADDEERSGYTGNEGATATFWYRRAAVLIVPAIMKLRFAYTCPKAAISLTTFESLRAKVQSSIGDKLAFLELCEAIIEPAPGSYYGNNRLQKHANPLSDLSVEFMIDSDCLEDLDRAEMRVTDEDLLRQPKSFGRAVVRLGLASLKERLLKTSRCAKSIAEKVSFFETIRSALTTARPPASKQLLDEFPRWYSGVLVEDNLVHRAITVADGGALAKLSEVFTEDVFAARVVPIVRTKLLPPRIGFVNYFTPSRLKSVRESTRKEVERIMRQIWQNLAFSGPVVGVAPHSTTYNGTAGAWTILLPGAEVYKFLNNAWDQLNPAKDKFWIILFKAMNAADRDAMMETVLPFVELVVTTVMPSSMNGPMFLKDRTQWCAFIRLSLERFLSSYIGKKPVKPSHWEQQKRGCHAQCKDCTFVNTFLVNPRQNTLDFPCSSARRHHLHSYSTDRGGSYTVHTIRHHSPEIWRITKNHNSHEEVLKTWQQKLDKVKPMMGTIMGSPVVYGMFGDEFDDVVKLRHSITGETVASLKTISGNATISSNPKRKRDAGDTENAPKAPKRTRAALSSDVDEPEVEVIDLTAD